MKPILDESIKEVEISRTPEKQDEVLSQKDLRKKRQKQAELELDKVLTRRRKKESLDLNESRNKIIV